MSSVSWETSDIDFPTLDDIRHTTHTYNTRLACATLGTTHTRTVRLLSYKPNSALPSPFRTAPAVFLLRVRSVAPSDNIGPVSLSTRSPLASLSALHRESPDESCDFQLSVSNVGTLQVFFWRENGNFWPVRRKRDSEFTEALNLRERKNSLYRDFTYLFLL